MTLKVYLLAGGLPLYNDLMEYPPKGIKYLPQRQNDYLRGISTYYSSATYQLKRKIGSVVLSKFKMPMMTYKFNHQSDLIHSTRGILVLNRTPWVIDLDFVGYFFGENMFNRNAIKKSHLKHFVSKSLSSDYCKKIICWSYAAKNSIVSVFNSNKTIQDKIDIVYPAIPAIDLNERTKNGKIKLLYVSSSFGPKGGNEVLLAFQKLIKKYDIALVVKCDVPEDIKAKYNFKGISYFPYRSQLLPRDELIKKYYMSSDIFVYPTFGDLFGLNLLDAMVAGLPIVTTNTFAIPEIVIDGKNGFLIEPPHKWHDDEYLPIPPKNIQYSDKARLQFVDQVVDKLTILIEDSALRAKLGKNGRILVEKGDFSINKRNVDLKRIYEESITN